MKNKPEINTLTPMVNFNRQGGWTFWSLSFTLSTLAFFSYIGMQLVPIYSVNSNIENAMTQSVQSVNLRTVGRTQIIQNMSRQLILDGSNRLLNYKEDLVIKRGRSNFTLQVSYERRVPVFGNIDLVVSFEPLLDCDFNGNCTKK